MILVVVVQGEVGVTNSITIGDKFPIKSGGFCEVLSYTSWDKVLIKHLDEHEHVSYVQAGNLRKGKIKNPFSPTIFGVGFMGVGSFCSRLNGSITPEYRAWVSMLERCYSESLHIDSPSYGNCTVHPDWHNFQSFAKWYTEQEFYGLGYHLDKDILLVGNREYSDKYCCLVPNCVNALVYSVKKVCQQKTPIGVHYDKNKRKYISSVTFEGQRERSEYFECAEDARDFYIKQKRKVIRMGAIKYKNIISERVYLSLLDFNVSELCRGDW